MDIRVGGTSEVGAPADSPAAQGSTVEAKLLGIRAPRRRTEGPPQGKGERRGATSARDPVNGRVLILMISDGGRLPKGIETGAYRVFLRFARR